MIDGATAVSAAAAADAAGMPPDLAGLGLAAEMLLAGICLLLSAALFCCVLNRRGSRSSSRVIGALALVLLLCGAVHGLALAAVWAPLAALLLPGKLLAAGIALLAALLILSQLPALLALRSPRELAAADQRLREEIAARERTEAELHRSLAALDRAVRELEQFADVAAHDLQAPLRSIAGFSQLLHRRHRDQLQGDAVEFLDYIDKGARQMQSLIRDLLVLSRIGRADPAAITRRPLADTVTRAIKALKGPIERTGAEIAFEVLPEVEANHGLLAQLLQQLIDNAIKFRRPGLRPKIGIGIERDGDHWQLTVTDEGIGIPVDQLDAVFAMFRRLHAAGTGEGTGVGLAICRRIATYHGGEIRALPSVQGSRFQLRLPVTVIERLPVLQTASGPAAIA